MGLVTRCPKCHSGFEVTADQLRLHDGLVRCGQCSHVFDGYAYLPATLPTLTRKVDAVSTPADPMVGRAFGSTESSTTTSIPAIDPPRIPTVAPPSASSDLSVQRVRIFAGTDSDTTPSLGDEMGMKSILPTRHVPAPELSNSPPHEPVLSIRPTPRFSSRGQDDSDGDNGPLRVIGEARVRGEDPSSPGRREPDFMDDPQDRSWRIPTFIWFFLSLVLLLALALQLTVYYRHDIVTALPTSRGILEQVCQRVGCDVSYARRPDRIVIIGSSLQQGEQTAAQKAAQTMPYALKLTLQNRNDASQSWPSLLLTLNDASGTVVVRKVLAPDQYLPVAMQSEPFAARQELALELPLMVEGHLISGFEVRRFFP